MSLFDETNLIVLGAWRKTRRLRHAQGAWSWRR
jgi:hypothetical protein